MSHRYVPILVLLAALLVAALPDHIPTAEGAPTVAAALAASGPSGIARASRTEACYSCDSNAQFMAWNEQAEPFREAQLVDGFECYELSSGNFEGWEHCSCQIGEFNGPEAEDWEPEACTLWGSNPEGPGCKGTCDWLPCGITLEEVPVESAPIAADGGLAAARFELALGSVSSKALEVERACSGAMLRRTYTSGELS